jgi:hypothetical protein
MLFAKLITDAIVKAFIKQAHLLAKKEALKPVVLVKK